MTTRRTKTARCAICGQRITWRQLPNQSRKGWRHDRPSPSGAPHDHRPKPS